MEFTSREKIVRFRASDSVFAIRRHAIAFSTSFVKRFLSVRQRMLDLHCQGFTNDRWVLHRVSQHGRFWFRLLVVSGSIMVTVSTLVNLSSRLVFASVVQFLRMFLDVTCNATSTTTVPGYMKLFQRNGLV